MFLNFLLLTLFYWRKIRDHCRIPLWLLSQLTQFLLDRIWVYLAVFSLKKKHFYFLDDFLSELARVLGSMLTTQYSILWGRPKAEPTVCALVEAAGGCMEAEGCMLLLKAKQPHAESMLSEQAYTSAMAAHTGLLHAIGAHLSGTTLSMLAFWVRMFQQSWGLDTLSKFYCEQYWVCKMNVKFTTVYM